MQNIELSIIVPLFNESESIDLLYKKIKEASLETGKNFEVIFIDDGSSDRTAQKAASIASVDKNLRVIEFRKNFGQTPAIQHPSAHN